MCYNNNKKQYFYLIITLNTFGCLLIMANDVSAKRKWRHKTQNMFLFFFTI